MDLIETFKAFETAYQHLYTDPDFLGIYLSADGTTLKLRCKRGSALFAQLQSAALPATAIAVHGAEFKVQNVLVVEDDIPTAHTGQVLGGSQARGVGLAGWGTLGWSIVLDGFPIGVSNWHVLCVKGNATQRGDQVEIITSAGRYEVVGGVYDFDEIYNAKANLWDFALVKYDSLNIPIDKMRVCDDGVQRAYPMRLGLPENINGQDTYWKVGARQPTCGGGKLLYVGSSRVDYGDGFKAIFTEQLIFEKLSDHGDSGSVVVHGKSETVVGLIFAGGRQADGVAISIANPLYRKGWHFRGTVSLDSGKSSIPVFSTKAVEATAVWLNDIPGATTPDVPPALRAGKQVQIWPVAQLAAFYNSKGNRFLDQSIHQTFNEQWYALSVNCEIALRLPGLNDPIMQPRRDIWWVNIPSGLAYYLSD